MENCMKARALLIAVYIATNKDDNFMDDVLRMSRA